MARQATPAPPAPGPRPPPPLTSPLRGRAAPGPRPAPPAGSAFEGGRRAQPHRDRDPTGLSQAGAASSWSRRLWGPGLDPLLPRIKHDRLKAHLPLEGPQLQPCSNSGRNWSGRPPAPLLGTRPNSSHRRTVPQEGLRFRIVRSDPPTRGSGQERLEQGRQVRRRLTSPRSRERPFSVRPGWNRVGAHWAIREQGAGPMGTVGVAYGGRGRALWEQWAGREERVGEPGGNKGRPVGNRGLAV
ncbi:unnamed protein product [Rangifer tarandus platyrhynchus]|uniref:Uncharacterized protein n=2 Tax=Rangifer tarandus platyrhynchus TaxID=3082113 RepID=A0ABN8YAS8_RANTA|nr:unnamed protein product [Rangifer tarandus platyrhynchus]CAI9698720.1 unnamed protein product [Rangifer tarandus platyrhynchus]